MTYPGIGENKVIYAVGDIHGCTELLDHLIGKIEADKAKRPAAKYREIYLGDYIDRGPDSAGVITRLRRRTEEAEVICLLGNHEAMLLGAADDKLPIDHWLENGGDATMLSYDIRPDDFGDYHRADLSRLPSEDLRFFRALQLPWRCGPYFFVHAGARPGVPLDRQKPEDMIWIREGFLGFDGPLGAVVVHGHTPVKEPEFRRNRIGIDTGAVSTGRLTCLRIDHAGVSIL